MTPDSMLLTWPIVKLNFKVVFQHYNFIREKIGGAQNLPKYPFLAKKKNNEIWRIALGVSMEVIVTC